MLAEPMTFDDQLDRYFGTRDLAAVAPAAMEAAVERMRVDLGLAADAGSRFALWCLLFTLGEAPDIDETFEERAEGELARRFMELSERDSSAGQV